MPKECELLAFRCVMERHGVSWYVMACALLASRCVGIHTFVVGRRVLLCVACRGR